MITLYTQQVMKYIPPFFVVFLLFVYGCSTQNTSKDNFNIVLITIDTLRADHLSCYGYERETSPNIDKIAKKGILFKNVIAPSSWTAPSMVSLFTSTYPINHGVIHGLASQKARGFSQEIFSEKLATLPEMLKKQGYTTFGVASNHLLTATFGFARGFDYFKSVDWKTADQINRIVYTWEDKIKKAKKYFLWMHYIDPHIPYHPRSPWIDQYISGDKKFKPLLARYDSEINYVDSYVGELIERFKLDKNTLLIITSDHGEQFLEHGRMRHSNNLHKEELHVPLIIKFPDISKMESIERQVSLLDVMPTILNALNTDQPEQTLGKPLMDNGGILSCLKKMLLSRRESRYNFAELDSNTTLKAIITPKWKYIYNYKNRSEQLYNIITDPLEQKNLLDKNIKLGNNLKGQLLQWVLNAKTYPPKSHLFLFDSAAKAYSPLENA
jgi:arylsulfatase A-like enzyme